jgi:DNA invertase Pin-like site-specific DNA recombinase
VELWEVGRGRRETQTAAGFFGVSIEGTTGEHYRRAIGEKTADALAKMRAEGRQHTRVPRYGERYGGRARGVSREEHAIIARAKPLPGLGGAGRARDARALGAAVHGDDVVPGAGPYRVVKGQSRISGRLLSEGIYDA